VSEPDKTSKERVGRVAAALVDDGKLIEAGFAMFAGKCLKGAPDEQLAAMRVAFMAGASHLWASMVVVMDPGAQPTKRDMRRMVNIATELRAWRSIVLSYIARPRGG